MAAAQEAGVVVELLGREHELAVIEQLLTRASEGEGAALVIRGEAGIGKTSLLDLARLRPEPMTVLHVTGVEAESELAFAGLFGLLRPVLEFVTDLPARQAAALEGALGLAPAS